MLHLLDAAYGLLPAAPVSLNPPAHSNSLSRSLQSRHEALEDDDGIITEEKLHAMANAHLDAIKKGRLVESAYSILSDRSHALVSKKALGRSRTSSDKEAGERRPSGCVLPILSSKKLGYQAL